MMAMWHLWADRLLTVTLVSLAVALLLAVALTILVNRKG